MYESLKIFFALHSAQCMAAGGTKPNHISAASGKQSTQQV